MLASIQIQDIIDVGRPGPAFGSGSGSGLAAGGSSKSLMLLPASRGSKSKSKSREPGRAVYRGLWRGQQVAVKTRVEALAGGRWVSCQGVCVWREDVGYRIMDGCIGSEDRQRNCACNYR